MTGTLTVLLDTNGDNVPETEIAGYIVGGPDRKALLFKDGTSSTSQDYAAGTLTLTVKDPDGDFSMENPNGAFRTIVESFTTAGDTDQVKNATTQQKLGQTFALDAAEEVDKIELYLKWSGSAPAGSAYVEVWHTTGGAPWALFEATAVSRSLTAAEIGTSYDWQAFTFEIPPQLDGSTTYAIVLQTSGYTYSAGVNELSWASNTGGYADCTMYKYNGSAWSTSATDLKFRISRNDIRDGRMVWVGVTVGGTSYPQWTGFLRAVLIDPDPTRVESTLIFTDSDDDAKLAEPRLATRANYKAEDALNEIFDTDAPAGFGLTDTQISIGNEEEGIPVWFQQPHDSISAVADKIADAFGGRVRWKAVSAANGWRRVVERSVVADQVESGTSVEDWGNDYKVEDLEYRWNAREALLINRAVVRANPRKAGAEKVVVGRYSGALPEVWGRAETRDDIWIDFSDPIVRDSGISPEDDVDITTGWTVNSVAWYSQKALLSITSPNVAAASGRTLDKLQLRARPYELQPEVVAIVEDTISQEIYKAVRSHNVDNPYIQSYGRAKSLAQALIRKFRRAYVNPRVHRIGHAANATTGEVDTWQSLAQRDIGDRINMTLPARINGGYSAAYYIEGRESAISIVNASYVIGQWDIWYRLRKAQDGYQFLGIDSGSQGQVIDIGVVAP